MQLYAEDAGSGVGLPTQFTEVKDSGQRQSFDTGAVRDIQTGKGRFDLVLSLPHMLTRLARHFENGARKYGDDNWKKGMPLRRFLDSAQRHVIEFTTGKVDEDHLTAAIWNLLCLGETQHEILGGRLSGTLDDLFMPIKPGGDRARAFAETIRLAIAKAAAVVEPCISEEAVEQLRADGQYSTARVPEGTEGPMPQDNQPEPFTVYLCGPITGQWADYDWRNFATAYFKTKGIVTLDPLRGKHIDSIENQGLGYKGQLAAPEIADRDEDDIHLADLVLAHFPYLPPRQSIGSLMEMGAAAIGLKKPVVLCTQEQVFKDHLFCRNFTTIFSEFRAALDFIVGKSRGK